MKKLVTHITSDENYYYLYKEVEIISFNFFFVPTTRIKWILLYENKCIEKVKEFETEAHQRFNFIETTKETIIN